MFNTNVGALTGPTTPFGAVTNAVLDTFAESVAEQARKKKQGSLESRILEQNGGHNESQIPIGFGYWSTHQGTQMPNNALFDALRRQ